MMRMKEAQSEEKMQFFELKQQLGQLKSNLTKVD